MGFSSEIFAFTSLNTEPTETPSGNAALSHCDASVQNTLLYLDTVAITLHSCTNINNKTSISQKRIIFIVLRALYIERNMELPYLPICVFACFISK